MLEYFLGGWKFISLDANGHFRGLGVGWETHKVLVQKLWCIFFGLGIEFFFFIVEAPFTYINIYGPCEGIVDI